MTARNLGMPYSEETERLILGTLINTRDSLTDANGVLTEECFYQDFHRKIFRTIKAIDEKGMRYDVMSVWNELKGKVNETTDWSLYLKIVENNCFDLPQHSAHLFDLSVRRKFWEIAQYLMSNVHTSEDILDVKEEAVKRLDSLFDSLSGGIMTMSESVGEVINIVNRNLSNPEPVTGSPTGFKSLDARGVLRPGNLTIIGADTSQGKTSLAISFCMNAASYGTKIAFYTMEMMPYELAARMLSCDSGVNGRAIVSSPLNRDELINFDRSIGKISNLPIYMDGNSTSSPDMILSSIRSMVKRFGIGGVVVDYLQILNVNKGRSGGSDEQQMGDVARKFKNIAKDLGIWVLALSQLSRDKMDVAPNLGRIRGSGQITEAADVVILLHRPEVYGRDKRYPEPFANVSTENTAMIDVAKGRNVGLMKMVCGFNAPTTMFYDLVDIPHIKPGEAGGDQCAF